MKHFVFYRESGHRSRRTGSTTYTFTIYELVNNKPVYAGTTEADSAAYKGDESTVMNYLHNEGKLPHAEAAGYYYVSLAEKGLFEITKL